MRRSLFLSFSFITTYGFAAPGNILSLDDYLGLVKTNHLGFKASSESAVNADSKSSESELMLAPNVFANYQYMLDEKEPATPAQGDGIKNHSFSLGVSKLTTFGLQGKLSYGVSSTVLSNTNPQLVPMPEFVESKPTLELSQSLWRNWGGNEVRSQVAIIQSQSQMKRAADTYQSKLILLEAEMAYWRMALARESTKIQNQTLERANKIYSWNNRRAQMQLADKADSLQADAAVKLRSLELQQAQEEERAAARAFNSARGVSSQSVTEALSPINLSSLEKISIPKEPVRDDLKVSELQSQLAELNSNLGLQKLTPTLELFGSFVLNGKDEEVAKSISESATTQHPTTVVGIRFSTPLDPSVISTLKNASRKDAQIARMQFERKKFDLSQEWEELNRKLSDNKKRLALTIQIADVQRQKLESERKRHSTGRTTTYQVLSFEQDYANSELNVVRTKLETLKIIAQLRLFGEAK